MTVIRFSRPVPAAPANEAAPAAASEDALCQFAEESYTAALGELADPEPFASYRAVAQLSGHLAVMRRAVLPAARHWLDGDRALPADCLAQARQTEWALRLLEGRLAGEACSARRTFDSVTARLEHCLGRYRGTERALLAALRDKMPGHEHDRLARHCRALLPAAPTRPHPRSPRGRVPAMLAFRFLGGWDRLMDEMDSRPGPRREKS